MIIPFNSHSIAMNPSTNPPFSKQRHVGADAMEGPQVILAFSQAIFVTGLGHFGDQTSRLDLGFGVQGPQLLKIT